MLPIKPGALAVIFCATVVALVFLVAFAELTDREVVMLGLVQTMLSVAIGWLLTHGYAIESQNRAIEDVEEQHQKNLKTYALKAAEKVENLSKEIARLERYLEVELEESGYNTIQEALSAKQERIESAIHVLNTLRSVNDTSLSDWRGVIPEELDQRRQETEQHERRLEGLLERLERIDPELEELDEYQDGSGADFEKLENEVGALKAQLKDLAREVGTPFIAKRRPSKELVRVKAHCPACGYLQNFSLRGDKTGRKALHCGNCHERLIWVEDEQGNIAIRERMLLPEKIACPSCEIEVAFELDEWPGSIASVECDSCDSAFKVSRASDGLRTFGVQKRLTPQIIEKVGSEMPKQPWEKGAHKIVAERLEITPKMAQQAIRILIERGVFQQQIDGVLYSAEQMAALSRTRVRG